MQRKINFMFYTPPLEDHRMNRAVAWYDPPYSHVEIGFENGVASSICAGETVSMHPRNYMNPNYDVLTLGVSEQAYNSVRAFCARAHENKVGFDNFGMFLSVLPFRFLPAYGDRTFCSRYVTEALQHGDIEHVRGLDSRSVTPSKLHAALSGRGGAIFDTVPGRCLRIT